MENKKIPIHTVRKFKGMEAEAVILIDVDQTLWQLPTLSYEPDPGILFYTAASRAKHELRIVCNMDENACNQTLVLMGERTNRRPKRNWRMYWELR